MTKPPSNKKEHKFNENCGHCQSGGRLSAAGSLQPMFPESEVATGGDGLDYVREELGKERGGEESTGGDLPIWWQIEQEKRHIAEHKENLRCLKLKLKGILG